MKMCGKIDIKIRFNYKIIPPDPFLLKIRRNPYIMCFLPVQYPFKDCDEKWIGVGCTTLVLFWLVIPW